MIQNKKKKAALDKESYESKQTILAVCHFKWGDFWGIWFLWYEYIEVQTKAKGAPFIFLSFFHVMVLFQS